MAEEVQFTIHLRGHSNAEEERQELEKMRVAFETYNMANPAIDEDSDSGDEMITAETLNAMEMKQ